MFSLSPIENVYGLSNVVMAQASKELDAQFIASLTEGTAPLTGVFDASASTGEGELSYRWRFGDGNTSEGSVIEHVFTEVGEFGVTLILTDANGEEDTYRQVITADGSEPATVLQLPYTIDEKFEDKAYIVLGQGETFLDSADSISINNYRKGTGTFLLGLT